MNNLQEILRLHDLWLNNKEGGVRANIGGANLVGANLYKANLVRANLVGANLDGANLERANLVGANLERANLDGANLDGANLDKANLEGAYLYRANLEGAYLYKATLVGANLYRANLIRANLVGANLERANLEGANLHNTNLSSSIGLINPKKWFNDNFNIYYLNNIPIGYIVYKIFGKTTYSISQNWIIDNLQYIEEEVNYNRQDICGCGINFATLDWCLLNKLSYTGNIWKCILHFSDLSGVCVPYNTDGKARCNRLQLLETVREIC